MVEGARRRDLRALRCRCFEFCRDGIDNVGCYILSNRLHATASRGRRLSIPVALQDVADELLSVSESSAQTESAFPHSALPGRTWSHYSVHRYAISKRLAKCGACLHYHDISSLALHVLLRKGADLGV